MLPCHRDIAIDALNHLFVESLARSSAEKRLFRLVGQAIGWPNPADFRVASSGPRPAQQFASLPSITTAGTERTPRFLARLATSASFMSSTDALHYGQASFDQLHGRHRTPLHVTHKSGGEEPDQQCLIIAPTIERVGIDRLRQ